MAKKKFTGTVVSNKMQKTVVVKLFQLVKHPRYHKFVRRQKKLYACSELDLKVGDKVTVEETRPLSKLKRWRVVEKL